MVKYKTKYTEVSIDKSATDPQNDYYGYMAVNLEWDDDVSQFFAESYDNVILDEIRDFFVSTVNNDKGLFLTESQRYEKNEINMEDVSILVNLKSPNDSKYGPDLVKIVRSKEKEFLDKIGEI